MSDEQEKDEAEQEPASERRDEDGIPLDRKPTLDDVRGGTGSGRATAVSCTVVVLLFVLGFWFLRMVVMR